MAEYRAELLMKIELLQSTLGNSPGELIEIVTEDSEYLYYYDGLDRWCCLKKDEEGNSFRYLGTKGE